VSKSELEILGVVAALCSSAVALIKHLRSRRLAEDLRRARSFRERLAVLFREYASIVAALLVSAGFVLAATFGLLEALQTLTSGSRIAPDGGVEQPDPARTCPDIAKYAPRFFRCPAQAFEDTQGTCSISSDFFEMSTGSLKLDYEGYCAVLGRLDREARAGRGEPRAGVSGSLSY